jgi:hypothetical protein
MLATALAISARCRFIAAVAVLAILLPAFSSLSVHVIQSDPFPTRHYTESRVLWSLVAFIMPSEIFDYSVDFGDA